MDDTKIVMDDKKKQILLKLFYKLVPESMLEHQPYDVRLRAYILCALIVLSISTTILANILSLFISTQSPLTLTGSTVLMVFCVVTYAYALRLFVTLGSFVVAGNFYAFSAYLSVVVTAAFSGGYTSPVIELVMLVPVLVFLMSGKISGLAWGFVAIVTNIVFYVMHVQGWQMEVNIMPAKLHAYVQVLTWITLFTAILGGLLVFDSVNKNLTLRLEQERNHFEYQAAHDSLTGLANRATFERRLEQTIEACKVNKHRAVLAIIDLDDFKPINDEYGHAVGDDVLEAVASRLKNNVRQTDVAARLGGDEFAVIFTDVDDSSFVERAVAKLVEQISEPIRSNAEARVTCSIGVVFCPEHGEDVDTLCNRADEMMYAAKEQKNRYLIRPT